MSLLVIGVAQSASARSAEIRMIADLNPPTGGIADGKADFRDSGISKRLNVEIEDVAANSLFTVKVAGKTIGSIRTNSFGIGELERNTNDGQTVPNVQKGDLVQILRGTTVVLSGRF